VRLREEEIPIVVCWHAHNHAGAMLSQCVVGDIDWQNPSGYRMQRSHSGELISLCMVRRYRQEGHAVQRVSPGRKRRYGPPRSTLDGEMDFCAIRSTYPLTLKTL
jgi:hypothetical protein